MRETTAPRHPLQDTAPQMRTEAWRRWLRALLSEPAQPIGHQAQPQHQSADPPVPDRRAGQ